MIHIFSYIKRIDLCLFCRTNFVKSVINLAKMRSFDVSERKRKLAQVVNFNSQFDEVI